MDAQEMEKQIVAWIKKQVQDAGCKGVIFGMSGGIDSAVVGALCKKAFPDNVMALYLPCFSNPTDVEHAKLATKAFNIPAKEIELSPVFSAFYKALEGKEYDKKEKSMAIANLKPRLRMCSLYYYANKLNYMVVGTGNKSEATVGYFTKYGDGGVDLLPIADLLKKDVRKLAKHLRVPQPIIDKAPTAGLWDGQTDEGEMGLSYEELDSIIELMEKKKPFKGIAPEKVDKVKRMNAISEHKRRTAPICKLK
ncbi:NAD+ synthase [Candidatus Woesearchaeota archaeon]|nr:NAD+ synthase [Candidatus Woesearchaeota archaeon]